MMDLGTNPGSDMITQLQINDVASVKVIDAPPASSGQDEVVDCNNLVNIGELSCSSSGKLEGDLVAEPIGNSSVHETSGTTEATLLSSSPEVVLPIKLPVDAEDDNTRNKAKSTSMEEKSVSKEENPVLKMLLRKWRYFDSGDVTFHLEGHACNRAAQKRRKLCYVCGDAQHNGKKCRKRRACFTCNIKGHVAEDCPKSDKKYDFCLKCGESGHDFFSCSNDYPPDDLKNILCYVCNEVGHLCCASYYVDTQPETSSCCNCGESGHSGFECPKPRIEKGSSKLPSISYKCGEQDHVGQSCTITDTGVPAQKCITNPKGETLDPMKSDPGHDESGMIDIVMETNDANIGQCQRKARKKKACQCGRVQ